MVFLQYVKAYSQKYEEYRLAILNLNLLVILFHRNSVFKKKRPFLLAFFVNLLGI